MKLIEQHRRHSLERGVALQHAREDSLRDDLDARAFAHASLQAHPIAHSLAGGFAQRRCHARRHGARRESARLEHYDLAASQPRFIQQRYRNNGAFARAGRGFHDGIPLRRQRRPQRGQDFVDRKSGFHEARILAPLC
jgi:hypothetical protein